MFLEALAVLSMVLGLQESVADEAVGVRPTNLQVGGKDSRQKKHLKVYLGTRSDPK